ncbi:hypothetical protein [Caballeronia humi]|uniref:Uncharacterized protein n=1 Tax=Caballeronia humi TaxID=326474 RepID=A0A158I181_9BURK|nr:hypothetical protein [Caballeronia humi]SAL50063.1 hypothetical protein AWB65_04053 [Caballeronia humi]
MTSSRGRAITGLNSTCESACMMEKLRFEIKAMKQRGYTSNGSSVGDLNSPGLLPESLTSLSPMSVEDGKPGVMKVGRAARKPDVNKEEEELLEIVATLTSGLHRADSRHSGSETQTIYVSPWQKEIASIAKMGGLGECPHEMARIVARSFYREMTIAGFSQSQIIKVASEIISELSVSVRRHSKRMTSKSS